MRLLLVNPPNGMLDRTDLAPPLGLLTLAAIVRKHNHQVSIIDFNFEVQNNPELGGDGFFQSAVRSVLAAQPDVVGLTSMCMESHVSLEIARLVKEKRPDIKIALGGTHFGAIARQTLEYFPFVDFVVSGEAEGAIVAILDSLQGQNSVLPKNAIYRDGEKIVTGAAEIVRPSMESLPLPAYDLVDLQKYFALNPRALLNYEAGRGCVFKCAFCYSPFQYGDAVRNKQPASVVEDLRILASLGAKHIFFIQDNLLNSPRWAIELCKQIADANLPLTWSCYITYPQLTKELAEWLSRARCIGVFTGIDAVSKDFQTRMNKRFFRDWQPVLDKLRYCVELGVIPTCALILEGPDQSPDEIEETIRCAIECVSIGCDVHINTLSVYNGSALEGAVTQRIPVYSTAKVDLLLDAPPVVRENPYATRWPALFPYHTTFYDAKNWEVFVAKVHTLFLLFYGLPLTLKEYVLEEDKSIWDKLTYIDGEFAGWLRQIVPEQRRSAAFERFCDHFASQQLSAETRIALGRETARFRLSRCQGKGKRTLRLLVDGVVETCNVSCFFNISQWEEKQKHRSGYEKKYRLGYDKVIYSGPAKLEAPNVRYDFALLSGGEDTVRYLSLSEKMALILEQIQEASSTGIALQLDKASIMRLEKEGWIWR